MAPSADFKKAVENPGIDPGASRMRSGRSTNELIPQQDVVVTGLAPNNYIAVITPASPHTLPHKTGGSFFNLIFLCPTPVIRPQSPHFGETRYDLILHWPPKM